MLCRLCYHNGRCIKIAGLHPGKSGLLLLIRTVLPVHIHKTMITIFVRDCNQISQSFYDSVIYNLPFHQLACSCGHAACLSIHGYYRRTVKLPSGPLRLRVCRVKCSECGATHAILLSSIVPYSQIPRSARLWICNDYEEGRCVSSTCADNPSIDENNVKSVLPKLHTLLEGKAPFPQDTSLPNKCADPFLFFGLFFPVHADTPAGQQTFSLSHITLPDRLPVASYNKEKTTRRPDLWNRKRNRQSH